MYVLSVGERDTRVHAQIVKFLFFLFLINFLLFSQFRKNPKIFSKFLFYFIRLILVFLYFSEFFLIVFLHFVCFFTIRDIVGIFTIVAALLCISPGFEKLSTKEESQPHYMDYSEGILIITFFIILVMLFDKT